MDTLDIQNTDFELLLQKASLMGLKAGGYLSEYPFQLALDMLMRQRGAAPVFPGADIP
jgi:hypothetical protein